MLGVIWRRVFKSWQFLIRIKFVFPSDTNVERATRFSSILFDFSSSKWWKTVFPKNICRISRNTALSLMWHSFDVFLLIAVRFNSSSWKKSQSLIQLEIKKTKISSNKRERKSSIPIDQVSVKEHRSLTINQTTNHRQSKSQSQSINKRRIRHCLSYWSLFFGNWSKKIDIQAWW